LNGRSEGMGCGSGSPKMADEPAEEPLNLHWAIHEIIISLQMFHERPKRLATEKKS
jgi:hypothetical protein